MCTCTDLEDFFHVSSFQIVHSYFRTEYQWFRTDNYVPMSSFLEKYYVALISDLLHFFNCIAVSLPILMFL